MLPGDTAVEFIAEACECGVCGEEAATVPEATEDAREEASDGAFDDEGPGEVEEGVETDVCATDPFEDVEEAMDAWAMPGECVVDEGVEAGDKDEEVRFWWGDREDCEEYISASVTRDSMESFVFIASVVVARWGDEVGADAGGVSEEALVGAVSAAAAAAAAAAAPICR